MVIPAAIEMVSNAVSDSSKEEEAPKSVTEESNTDDNAIDKTKSKNKKKSKEKDYVKAGSNKQANEWAKKSGYNNAEDLKRDFVGSDGSKFNIYKNRDTGELILIGIKTAHEIYTGLYAK